MGGSWGVRVMMAAPQCPKGQPGLSLAGTVLGQEVFAGRAAWPSALPRLPGERQRVLSHRANLGGGLIAHHSSPLGKLLVYSILSSLAGTPKMQAAPQFFEDAKWIGIMSVQPKINLNRPKKVQFSSSQHLPRDADHAASRRADGHLG